MFGSAYIEAEHLLLGLLREDKALANRFLGSHAAVESIRKQIEGHTAPGDRVPTSVDLPLSHECKRVLTYGAEEAERLNQKHIGTEHLLLGLLREEESFAAQLLDQHGLTLKGVREYVRQSAPPLAQIGSPSFARLDEWLAEREAHGGIRIARQERVANRTCHFAIYAGDPPEENDKGRDMGPAEELAQIQKRIDSIVEGIESAITYHEFEKARFLSNDERKERENLRSLRERFNLEESPPRAPLLCIDIIREERFSDVHERCEAYMAAGVAQVWLLHPKFKCAYTVTKSGGLRELKGEILQIADPPLEMDLRRIFS